MGSTGKKVKGWYSFIYVGEDGEWKISHHHSSIMPEEIMITQPIIEMEVGSLFKLWNDALTSKDPTKVAKCYSKNEDLLPTVSGIPWSEYPSIVDYFTNFLKLEPQGEILEGKIVIRTDWAQYASIYKFTIGATRQKVQGQYTYTYIVKDNQWKISHHHSSVMPKANEPKIITKEEIRNLIQLLNSALTMEDPNASAK